MPKLVHSLPKYRKHKPSGQAVVTIAGKDHYLGPHGTGASHHEYDRLIAEYLARGRRPALESEEAVSVNEVLLAFLGHAKKWYVKNGQQTNEFDAYRVLMRDVKKLYGNDPACEFGPLALKAVRQRLIDRGQARTTVNKNVGRVRQIFKWAASEELVPATVHQSLTTVRDLVKGRCDSPEPAPIKPVELQVIEQTIRYLPQVTSDMVRFQLLTGARPGEVVTLTPANVERSDEVWEYLVDGHKTEHHGRRRIVFIGPEAQAVLTPYLFRDNDIVCFSMAESLEQRRAARAAERKTAASCGNRRGKRSNADRKSESSKRTARFEFNSSSYRHAVHYACNLAFPAPEPLAMREGESNAARMRRLSDRQAVELKEWQKQHRWSPNQLRHTKATEIRKHFGLEASQVILGHAAADVTQIYAERDAEKAREVARKIG